MHIGTRSDTRSRRAGSQHRISAPDRTPDRAELVVSKAPRRPTGHAISPDSVASKAFSSSSEAFRHPIARDLLARKHWGTRWPTAS